MSGKTAEIIGDLAGVSRSSAQKFFKGQPISVENFRSLCEVLELNWEEIVNSEEIASSVSSRKRVAFVIEGSLDDLDPTTLAKIQAMVGTLQRLTGDASMTVVKIEEGSIRLILEGTEKGIERLKQLFDQGELAEVLSIPVRDVEPIESDIPNEGEDALKTLLISTIRSQGAVGSDLDGTNLSGTNLSEAVLRRATLRRADLSGAFLSGADLRKADLSGANLRRAFLGVVFLSETFLSANLHRANLREADLSEADLSGTDLSEANLREANLLGADLLGADLFGADLFEANVESTRFGSGLGLSEDEKQDLQSRGAIFDESTGDLSSINSPLPSR